MNSAVRLILILCAGVLSVATTLALAGDDYKAPPLEARAVCSETGVLTGIRIRARETGSYRIDLGDILDGCSQDLPAPQKLPQQQEV